MKTGAGKPKTMHGLGKLGNRGLEILNGSRLGPAVGLTDFGTNLPPQDAAIGNPKEPRIFWVLPKLKKAMDGFSHRQPRLGGLVALAWLVMAGAAEAQTAPEPFAIAAAYGSGVHAYFAGDYPRSEELLTAAIEAGSADPRVWYFRGLALLRTGRLDEAEADFTEGASREISRSGRWPVSRSLERVQGLDRLRLERHRVRARVAALQNDVAARKKRYDELTEGQLEVLRPSKPAAGEAEAGRPFEQPKDAEPLPKPAPADADDPFAPPPGAAPKADDPFGT